MPNAPKTDSTGEAANPQPDYPLFPHATGRWAKKVRAELDYFGSRTDPAAALMRWLAATDYPLTDRMPKPNLDSRAVRAL